VLAPADVVAAAVEAGVATLALTDHDTLSGIPEALDAAGRLGLDLIPGIELSVLAPSGSMHLLGYFREPEPRPLVRELDDMRARRADRARQIVARLNELGVALDYADVEALAAGPVGRPHVAEALRLAGHVKDRQEAFDRYLADGGPAHVSHAGLTPAEAVRLVADSGGAPVLAHPDSLSMKDGALEQFVGRLAAAGLLGIEVHRRDHGSAHRRRFGRLAQRYGLVASGGSDFHRPEADRLGDTGQPALPADVPERLGVRPAVGAMR